MRKQILHIVFLLITIILILILKSHYKYTDKDIQLILNYYLEKTDLNEEQFKRLDLDKNNGIDLFDAVLILQEKESDK